MSSISLRPLPTLFTRARVRVCRVGVVIDIVAAVADIFHTRASEGSRVGVSSILLRPLPTLFTRARVRVLAWECHRYRCGCCRYFSHARE
jgi:hypothetical protein